MCSGLKISALCLVMLLSLSPGPARAQTAVDLELALLVDVSASVSDEEYRLQAAGIATAFRSAAVLDAIRSVARRGIAVSVIQWADGENQRVAIAWTLLHGDADVLELAAQIEFMPRHIHGGHTALGSALEFATRELENNRFEGLRRVIDLSGDGRNNDGYSLRAAREEALEHGITVNGLAILNELPLLDDYFRDYLIGGEGAFFMVAQDYSDFAEAMIHKLEREIRSLPLSLHEAPNAVYGARTVTPGPLAAATLRLRADSPSLLNSQQHPISQPIDP